MAVKLFISDVHLGAGRFSADSNKRGRYPYDWDWLSTKETDNFLKFIKFLSSGYDRDVEAVILLGDIFDNWVFPYDLVPPTMEELLVSDKNKEVVEELDRFSRNTKVYYVPGNHDMHASADIVDKYLPKFIYCPVRYAADRLIAEHGHRYALFNAPPRFSNNILGLPLGYFITRIEATRKAMTNSQVRAYKTYVDDFVEMLGEQTMPQSVLEAVIEEAGLDEDIAFKIKRRNGQIQTVSALEVKEVYKNIYNDWPNTVVSKPRAVFAELDLLGPIADKLCKDGYHQVCVFGHSHKSELDADKLFVNDRIYANCGYWCGERCTFVETNRKDGGYDVNIVQWMGNNEIRRTQNASI